MCGEHRLQLGSDRRVDDVARCDAAFHESGDHRCELAAERGTFGVQGVDAVHLLGGVGQVEVHGECTSQPYGVDDIDIAEHVDEVGAGLPGPANPSGETTNVLDQVQQTLAVLTHQCITELGTQTPDVVAQRGVDIGEIARVVVVEAGSVGHGAHRTHHGRTAGPSTADTRSPAGDVPPKVDTTSLHGH